MAAGRRARVEPSVVERARRGDRTAQAVLLQTLQDVWFRFSQIQLRDPDAARDATQETAVRVLRGMRGFRGDSRFETWPLGIALNVGRGAQRARVRWLPVTPRWLESRGEVTTQAEREPAGRVASLLGDLAPRQREALTLRYLEDLSVEETARLMKCAEGTVKATVSQALRILRERHGSST